MREILTILLLAALLAVALKLALMLLILAGLIFRPHETVGLNLFQAIVAGFKALHGIGFAIAAKLTTIGLFRGVSEQPAKPSGPALQRLTSS